MSPSRDPGVLNSRIWLRRDTRFAPAKRNRGYLNYLRKLPFGNNVTVKVTCNLGKTAFEGIDAIRVK